MQPETPATDRVAARSATDERGAALVVVIALLLVTSVIMAGLFGLAIVGTTSLKTYKDERGERYAADSALDYGVRNIALDSTLGVTDGTGCSWSLPVEGPDQATFSSGSTMRVRCEPYVVSTGVDTDLGQKVRFVRLYAECYGYVAATKTGKPQCSSNPANGTATVMGTAKVRFDLNYRLADPTKRAVVPKVITWKVRR